jgi:hypothetical protein
MFGFESNREHDGKLMSLTPFHGLISRRFSAILSMFLVASALSTARAADGPDSINEAPASKPAAPSQVVAENLRADKSRGTRFGIFYETWHCLALRHTDVFDISKALAGSTDWGPVPAFHFWTEPRPGYYCLDPNAPEVARHDTDVNKILRLHARELHDAGIDFIILDASNQDVAGEGDAKLAIQDPFSNLLNVWDTIPDAPKVAVFAPLTANGTMMDWLLGQLAKHPNLEVIYEGKPLALVVDTKGHPVDPSRFSKLSEDYTLRRTWGLLRENGDKWSFMNACADDRAFRASQGNSLCRQNFAEIDGKAEQIPVVAAFQETYMSDVATAVPRFHGRTFVAQFATAFAHPNVPFVTFDGWNEWIAQRFCVDARGHLTHGAACVSDTLPNGNRAFVDAYDEEHSRDFEPAKGPPGDFYYRLLKDCISKYRLGRLCQVSDVGK